MTDVNTANAQNKARAAIESTYIGVCDVIEYTDAVSGQSHFTKKSEVTVYTALPCRLSFNKHNNIYPSVPSDTASAVSQLVKLFLAPETNIKSGSKIVVTQNGVTTTYKSSGAPSVYVSHQEIPLQLFDGWC